jgi:hypothetical protein
MKQVLLTTMAMVLLISAAFAQHQHGNNPSVPMGDVPQPEYFFMREEGKLLHVINGKETPMQKPLTLESGIMVLPAGIYHLKNGKEKKLRVGEAMDARGKVYSSITVLLKKTLPAQRMPAESQGMPAGSNPGGHQH